jgi:phospholipid transport system substrate-binding protein
VGLYWESDVKQTLTFFYAVLLAALALSASAAHAAAPADSPDGLVKALAEEVLSVIRTTKDKALLRKAAEQKVLPHFDFRAMTQLAVGQHWRQATPEQQKALEDAFRALLINTYTASLNVASTGKESVDVKPVELKPGDTDVIVRSVVRTGTRQPIPVDYRMTKGAGGWKVYDVVVENLSLVTNYRSSFASEIGRSGIDGLVKALQTKNSELAKAG